MSVAAIFPGQGTQQHGMAASWRDDPAWEAVEHAEAALGEPLAPLVLDADADLGRTRNAQLAVLLTSLVVWRAVTNRSDLAPGCFAGHSLGQVTALIAAGVLGLDEGVRFAARRAELTQAAADAHPGRMVACIGADPEQAAAACDAAPDACWVANDNAPGQVVLAGTPEGVEAATAAARDSGIRRVLPLDVGGAFHTPLMDDARTGLVEELSTMTFHDGTAPVVSNDDGAAYHDGEGWRSRLAEHVVRPVRWRTVMETLVSVGSDPWLEIGHGSMLAGLARRGARDTTVYGIAEPDDVDHADDLGWTT